MMSIMNKIHVSITIEEVWTLFIRDLIILWLCVGGVIVLSLGSQIIIPVFNIANFIIGAIGSERFGATHKKYENITMRPPM